MCTSTCLVTRATDEHSTPIYPPSATHCDPVPAVRDVSHSTVVRGATGCMYTSSDAGDPLYVPIVSMCIHGAQPTFGAARLPCCAGTMITPRTKADAGALFGSVMLAEKRVAISMNTGCRELRTLCFKPKHRDETITILETGTLAHTAIRAATREPPFCGSSCDDTRSRIVHRSCPGHCPSTL